MICKHCAARDHPLCPGCPCQHVGTRVPYLDKEARHQLVLEHAGQGGQSPVDLVTVRSNGPGGTDDQ